MTYYHATNASYNDGEDLVSLLGQLEAGWITSEEADAIAARWEVDDSYLINDGAMVSLTASLDEAREILATWNNGEGRILAVDGDKLEADGLLRTNSEGYPAVSHKIEAWCIIGEVA